jgi:alkylhydroperoxidase family enzyme
MRIPPLREDEWTEKQRQQLEGAYRKGGFYNLVGTLTRHPEASKRIGQVSAHVLGPTSTLPARDRELLILRTAWLCQAEYEWAQHRLISLKAGMTEEEIDRCRAGPDADGWKSTDAALLRAADDLHAKQRISDANWEALAQTYNDQQMMDIVFAVGQYTLVAMAMNSFGVPLDDGLQGF